MVENPILMALPFTNSSSFSSLTTLFTECLFKTIENEFFREENIPARKNARMFLLERLKHE